MAAYVWSAAALHLDWQLYVGNAILDHWGWTNLNLTDTGPSGFEIEHKFQLGRELHGVSNRKHAIV